MRLLLVEDDQAVGEAMELVLIAGGCMVFTAGNGQEALTILSTLSAETPLDGILSDVEMPVMGGVALVEELRRLPGAPPIVLMTCGDARDAEEEAGVACYVKANLGIKELRTLVVRHFGGGKSR
jgi:CheY-like chemotaxis protein